MNPRYDSYDENVVDALLGEAGEQGHEELRAALLDLRSFAHTPAPAMPAAARSRRLAGGRRRAAGRRAVVTSLVVAATLGLGAGAAAAASPAFRETALQAVAGLVGPAAAPASSVVVHPAAPAPETAPDAVEATPPAETAQPATPPAVPGQAASNAGTPADRGREHGQSTALTHRATPTLPPEAPLSGHVPAVKLPADPGEVAVPGHGSEGVRVKVRVPGQGKDEAPGRSGSAGSAAGSKSDTGSGRSEDR